MYTAFHLDGIHNSDLPGLEFLQLKVDLLNIHISPQYVIVAIDSIDDIVVQAIQFVQ